MLKYQKNGTWFLVLVFFISLVSVPNIGQQAGIQAPYNLAVYGGVAVFVLFTFFNSLSTFSFNYSHLITFAILVATFFLVIGSLNSSWQEIEYTFYSLLVGLLFIIALLQYQWQEKHWFWFFYAIVVLALIQSCIALVQRFDSFGVLYWWTGYFPFKFHSGYLGSLQQRNMLASFLAFAVVVSFWLALHKEFLNLKLRTKLPIFLVILVGVFITVGSGSRAGFLGLILGIVFLLFSLQKSIKLNIYNFVLILILAFLGALAAIAFPIEVSNVSSKLEAVVYGSDVRLFLYETGWKLFLQNFWFGVGIGNYPAAFQEFVSVHGLFFDKRIIDLNFKNFTHPHNELLFWLIQVGVVGCLPVLISVGLLLKNWWQQGCKPFFLYIGLSFPLVLQIMVSYPLILSATHYFLTMVILVFTLKLPVKRLDFHISSTFKQSVRAMFLIVGFWIVYGVYAGLMSAFETYYFKNRLFFYQEYREQEKIGYFHFASSWDVYHNLVFVNMENLFLRAREGHNFYDLNQYLLWYENQENMNNLPESLHIYAIEAKSILKSHKVIAD